MLTYVNALGLELHAESTSLEGFPLVFVNVILDNQQQTFSAFLLKGGHRILLPDNASHFIFEALHHNQSVEIKVAHYSTTIIPDEFARHYQTLIN